MTYRALQREFALDDAALADLRDELIDGEQVARDEQGKVLVWTGTPSEQPCGQRRANAGRRLSPRTPRTRCSPAEAERRQLTVMFCDLVGSTALSTQLDPEELREVVQPYQETCTAVIQRYDGYIAQYLGDGLLVYFGYPAAHEDDAQRAVRTSLEIVEVLQVSTTSLLTAPSASPHWHSHGVSCSGGDWQQRQREVLALGETPNLAARLQGLAEPDTVVISAATSPLGARVV